MTRSIKDLRILVATTWHPLDGLPTYCPFTQRMIEASREAGMDVDLIRPVPWYRWFQQRRRSTEGGRNRFPISWKPFPRESSWKDDKFHASAILRCIKSRKKQYDLVHVHGMWASLVMGSIVCEKLNLPMLLHAHDTEFPTDHRTLEAMSHVDRILAVSLHQKKSLITAFNQIKHRIRVIPNGIPSCFFDTPYSPKKVQSGLSTVYVGRLHRNKGLDWLLTHWSSISQPNDRLDIFGEGPQEAELRQIIETQKIGSTVRIIGRILNSQLPEILAKYDLFLSPTRIETFGIANVEALATGRPIIVSDLPITREILGNCVGVKFVPLEDKYGFQKAMDEMRTNLPDSDLIRASVRCYNMENTIRSLGNHYLEVVEAAAIKSGSIFQPAMREKHNVQ